MYAVTRTFKAAWAWVKVMYASAINGSPRVTVHKFPVHDDERICLGAMAVTPEHALQKASALETAARTTIKAINLYILRLASFGLLFHERLRAALNNPTNLYILKISLSNGC
jgi:hypothetical protein